MSRISKFGILELSRQKKQSTIQEISYTACPYCKGRGARPSLEYTALGAFRKIESQAVKGNSAALKVKLPYEIADYLLNRKRNEISKLESTYDISINISGSPDTPWDELKIESVGREKIDEAYPEEDIQLREAGEKQDEAPGESLEPAVVSVKDEGHPPKADEPAEESAQPVKKKSRRRPRYKKKKTPEKAAEQISASPPEQSDEMPTYKRIEPPQENKLPAPVRTSETEANGQDLLNRLRKVFEQLEE
jgi:ribonuclease E